jgi:hypothetical protein
MSTAPPVLTVLRPDVAERTPPAPLVPLPTPIVIPPLRPPVAAPVLSVTAPELSSFDVPVANTSLPELPDVPAFSDLIVTVPLVVVVLLPDVSVKPPPVLEAALV